MELILLRHAKSSWVPPYRSDWHRGLSPRGERSLPQLVAQLRRWSLQVDTVVSSDAVRAWRTALAVADAFPTASLIKLPELYRADAGDIRSLLTLHGRPDQVQVWVGHNPAVQELAEQLGGVELEKFATAAMAWIQLDESLMPQGPIRLWSPKEGERLLG